MEPLQYASQVLDLHGAVVEPPPAAKGALDAGAHVHALLPDELAARLGWEEEMVLAGQPARPELAEHGAHAGTPQLAGHADEAGAAGGTRLIGYGSADLDKLLDLLRGDCSVVRVRVNLPWPHARSLAQEVSSTFRFHTRIRMTYRETQASHARYLFVHYALNAVSEETYERLIPVVINLSTLSPVAGLAAQLTDTRLFTYREGGRGGAGGPTLKAVCGALNHEASRVALDQLNQFVGRVERRRKRDAKQLHGYYEALAQEVRRRKGRGRQLTAARVDAKLQSIRSEYERKIRDLDVRYALRVHLRPAAAVQMDLPVLRGTYHLQWRRAERTLPVTWNPLLRALEPVACDGCGRGCREMTIDDQLRVRCRDCTVSPSQPA